MFIRFLLCGLLASLFSAASHAAAPSKPNILFLLSDDHSYPFLSCYGDTNVRTPNIDRLAAGGMRFHRLFTGAPQCVPSRACYMTGRSPVADRITRFSSPLPREETIFPELLRSEAGYFTGVCGRIYHLDGAPGERGGVSGAVIAAKNMRTMPDRVDYVDVSQPAQYASRVDEFFSKKPADKPFFLWVNFSDPHHPWDARDFEPDPATLKIPAHWPDTPAMRKQLAMYCGEVNRVDTQVQQILDTAAKHGFNSDNTIIIFAGDNGMAFPHGKGALHDPGLNVPLIVRWTGTVKPNSESRELISGEDLAPTVLEIAGVKVPSRITGQSFAALLRGEKHTPRTFLFAERGPHGSAPVAVNMRNSGFDLSRCVRTDHYKFIYNCTPWIPYAPVDSAGDDAWRDMVAADSAGKLSPELHQAYFTTPRPVYEFYDLDKDPSELTNLSGKPEVAKAERELRSALIEKMVTDFDYLPLPANVDSPDSDAPPAKGKKGGKRRAE